MTTNVRHPPGAAARQGAARIVGFDIGIVFMGSTLLTPLYGLYRDAFGFSEVTLTLVYAAYVIGNVGALFLFGRLADQIGRRRASLPALALGLVAVLVFLCATSTPWLFVGRVLTGLAVGVAGSAGTAWVAELVPGHDKARASSLTTAANLAGVAAGPLLAGVLADFAPAPLRTPYVVYLGLLAWVIWRVSGVPETVASPVERLAEASFKPRLGVPADIRTRFAPPAVAAFASFAFGGYYAGLLPNLVSDDLGIASRAVAGGIVAEAYGIAALAVLASRRLASRDAMLWGLVLLLPGIGGLLLAKMSGSIAVLALGSAIGGAGLGLCYRGTLQVINAIAPAGQRAEVVSSFMIVCFLGNSLPVVGVAVAGRLASPQAAQFGFAGLVALLALLAFATGWKWVPKQA